MLDLLIPKPTGIELSIKPNKLVISKTNLDGKIISINDYFIELSGYKECELVNNSHKMLRHPDMPRSICQLVWNNIQYGKRFKVIMKQLAKNGNHFWLVLDIEIKKDNDGVARNYIAYGEPISKKTKKNFENLYKKIKQIEDRHGTDAGIEYLFSYLEENNLSYDKFIEKFINKKTTMLGALKGIFK